MAKENTKPEPSNVLSMTPSTTCCVEKCTQKGVKLNFCGEHYTWFKEGLVNKKGQRPSDFDKKFQAYSTRKKAA